MSGNGSTLISDLDNGRDQPDLNEVEDLLRQISESDTISNDEGQQGYAESRDEPSQDDIEAAMRQAHQAPGVRRAAHAALKTRGRRKPQPRYEEEDEYAPIAPAIRKQATSRFAIVQHLHLPVIVALMIVVVFASPLNDIIGTWIPTAAGAIYTGALQPTGLYLRAGLVGVILFVYKYLMSTIFPSIPL